MLKKIGILEHPHCPPVKPAYKSRSHDQDGIKWNRLAQSQQRNDSRLSLYSFNLFAEYILREAVLENDECGFKTRRNINNLCFIDNISLTSENTNELQILVIKDKDHYVKNGVNFKYLHCQDKVTDTATRFKIENKGS